MSDPQPTPRDIERANDFLRAQGRLAEAGEDLPRRAKTRRRIWFSLALEFARVCAEEREACAELADNEMELPGPMPDKVWALTREHAELSLRSAVRVTKKSIAQKIRARGEP